MTRDAKGFLTFNVKIFTLLQGYVKFQANILTGSPVSILARKPLASLSIPHFLRIPIIHEINQNLRMGSDLVRRLRRILCVGAGAGKNTFRI